LLISEKESKSKNTTTALILVPTRELAQQVTKVIGSLSALCSKDVRTINLTEKIPEAVLRTRLADAPDIAIATPARAAQNLLNSALSVEGIAHLVIDEADLLLSYGYDDDLQIIAKAVPQGVQTFLMSATLTTDVTNLRSLFCRDPVILDFKDETDEAGGVSQYIVKYDKDDIARMISGANVRLCRCAEDEKFLLAYVVFKLKLIKGKCIIFVGDIDRCYRLKLFFEQFGIKSCVLNSELPINSRLHVVEEFNKNVYDIIIAADEHEVLDVRDVKPSITDETIDDKVEETAGENHPANNGVNAKPAEAHAQFEGFSEEEKPAGKLRKRCRKSKEYGVSRGIDFQNVACVLNFDMPTTSKSYTHRIGRTARAGKTGMALSFVVPAELYHKHKPTTIPSAKHDEDVLAKITRYQQKKGKEVKPYHFDMKQVNAFRYRMNDALRAVTRIAIREARTRELRQELLKSEKLRRHFEENPEDLHHLRHDGELRAARVQQHLRHVPDYLMPSNGNRGIAGDDVGFVGLRKTTDNRIRKARMQNRMKGKGRNTSTKRSDPLKTFNAKGRR